jgi:hypothetical protein
LIINIGYEEKIGRFGSVAGGAPFGRQPLQLARTAEREAESAADQAPLNPFWLNEISEFGQV